MIKKFLLISSIFFISYNTNAQFRGLLKKAQDNALGKVFGTNSKDSSNTQASANAEQPDSQPQTEQNTPDNEEANNNGSNVSPKPKTIDFPITGDTVTAVHALFSPVIDGDIENISKTPEGKYGLSLARQKGLKGSDMEIFRQLLKPENNQLMEDITTEVEKKFSNTKNKDQNVSGNSNPAHGGFSTPSLYFYGMIGSFNVWMTNRYVKWALNNDHPTMAQAFGMNVVSITDLQTNMAYNIGSILGVQYSMVKSLDTIHQPYGPLAIMPIFNENYNGIEGIKYETGAPEKFGEYNCSVVKIIVPVRLFTDKETGRPDKSLLSLHDILSGKDDAIANDGKGNWDPSYKIIFKGYYSHDIEKYLPEKIRERIQNLQWKNGMGVGSAIADEKGNSADFRLIDITTDNKMDKGQFQVPKDYPVMTQEELNEAIKKQFKFKNLLKKSVQKSGSGE